MLTLTRTRNTETRNHVELARRRGRLMPARSAVYHQGDAVEGFFYVNSGVIMVFRLMEDSTRQISGFYTSGDLFGFAAGDEHRDGAVCITTASVARLTMADVAQDPKLQRRLYETTCGQLDAAQRMITTLTRKSASQKVAAFLVMLADQQRREGPTYDIDLPMSRQDIADYLGMSIETVSRRMTALKTIGIITIPSRRTISVKSPDRLKAEAGPIS